MRRVLSFLCFSTLTLVCAMRAGSPADPSRPFTHVNLAATMFYPSASNLSPKEYMAPRSLGAASALFPSPFARGSTPAFCWREGRGITGVAGRGINDEDADTSAQATPKEVQQINKTRLALVGGGLFGSMLVIHLYQQSGWWRDNRAPFHFQEDLLYGLNVDKFGHFYGGYLLGFVIDKSLRWANVREESAMWYGAAGGLLFQTYVEIEDGFSKWGFDRVDFASDVAGSLFWVSRYYVPFLRNFDPKLSYHPSDLLGNPGGIGFKGQKHLMIDDYEGQTLWLAVKVHNLLPDAAKPYWPGWLNVALGYGVRDVADPHPYRVYFLAPDLDMTKVIPQTSSFLKTLGEALNFIHMPLPAVQFTPDGIWYGLYF